MAYDGTIRIDTRVDGKGFNSGVKNMMGSLKGMAAAVGIAFGVGAIVRFGATAVQEASKLAGAMTGLQSVLSGQGRSFADAQKFINDYTKDGLIPATNAIVAYKNLALRGYDDSQIQQVMQALKDSSAFARASHLTMGEAVQTASEGLKNENSILVDNAGVTKNVSKMWDDYAKSIGTTAAMLTQQQKVQAEVNGIMEESKYQTGDAAKISGSYAGMVAALGTSFYNLKTAIGNAIIPVLSAIIPYIKAVVDWFVVLFNTIARVIALFFGVSISAADTAASTGEAAANTEAAAGGAGDLADNTKAAGKAAKGALAAFDELNVLATQEATGGTGGAGVGGIPGIGDIGAGEPIDLIPDEWADDIAAFKETLLGMLEPAIEALERLKEALEPLGILVWEGLQWAWENILVPFGTWVITEAVPAFLDLLAGAVTVLTTALEILKPVGIWLWENFLQPIAEWVGDKVIEGLQWLTEKLYAFSDWMKENPEYVQTFGVILGVLAAVFVIATIAIWAFNIAVAVLTSPITLVILAIAALTVIIVALVKYWEVIKEKAGLAWDWIVAKWQQAAAWFNTKVVEPIKNFFAPMWEFIKILAHDAWLLIQYVWEKASTWYWENVIEPLRTFFSELWEEISGFFSTAWDKVVEIWGGVSAWFKTTVTDPIKEGFKIALDWIKEKWETIFNGISKFVKGIINTIIDLINGLLQAVVAGINGLINAANRVGSAIPGYIPIPNVVAPQIPKLASGAVIPPNAEFLALMGDQRHGRNLEAPEELIRQIVREESGGTDIRISFEGTLGALIRELKPRIDRENMRIGRSLISGGVTN